MEKVNLNKLLGCTAICTCLLSTFATAKEVDTNMARMQAMDKITGRVSVIEVPVNGEVEFGSFSINVRACKTRPPEEAPENFAFVDVVDKLNEQNSVNIFKGWMLSSSPALNAVEHPIYDVWLLKCIDGKVDSSKLLTAEQLKDRDSLPKASDFKDKEEKIKTDIDLPELYKDKMSDTAVETTEEKAEVVPEVDNADKTTEISKEIAVETVAVEDDGAPKSLINMEAVEEETTPTVQAPALEQTQTQSEETSATLPSESSDIISEINEELSQQGNSEALKTDIKEIKVEPKSQEEVPAPLTNNEALVSEKAQQTVPETVQETVPAEIKTVEPIIPAAPAANVQQAPAPASQLIDFSDDIPEEDGFELNADALQ